MAEPTKQITRAAGAAPLVLAAANLIGCGQESEAGETVDRTFTVSGPARLELENASGSSSVRVGAPGEVRVHAEFRVHSWPWEDPGRTLREVAANPPFSQQDSLIRIGHSNQDTSQLSAEYSVTVPPETEMRGVIGSGNLEVNGIAGPANFTVGSGNISATAIVSDIRAIVGSGNVTLPDSKGRIDAIASSGILRIEQPGTIVEAEAGSGRIEVRGATADLRLRTGSGEITVDGNPGPSSYWDIRANSGEVELEVPSSASFKFYARSGSGDINATSPSVTEKTPGKHDFEARIGDGKARVEVETSSGSVSLH